MANILVIIKNPVYFVCCKFNVNVFDLMLNESAFKNNQFLKPHK